MTWPEWLPLSGDVAGILHDSEYRLHNVQDASYVYISEGRVGQSPRIVHVPMNPAELEWMQIGVIARASAMPLDRWIELLTERRDTRERDAKGAKPCHGTDN